MEAQKQPKEVQEAIELQKRANEIVLAALADDQFMKGVLEAQRLESSGGGGESWTQIKARLGLV